MGFDEFGSEIELDGEMSFFVIGNNLIFFFFLNKRFAWNKFYIYPRIKLFTFPG